MNRIELMNHNELIWGGPRPVKADLIPAPEVRYTALAGSSEIQDLLGLGLLLAHLGPSWPILANLGSVPAPHTLRTLRTALRTFHFFHILFLFQMEKLLWFFAVYLAPGFLSSSVRSWQALAGPGRPWQATTGPGRLRQALAGLSLYHGCDKKDSL